MYRGENAKVFLRLPMTIRGFIQEVEYEISKILKLFDHLINVSNSNLKKDTIVLCGQCTEFPK